MSEGNFIVSDLSLADWGRREIELAEVEMPGLMSCRAEFGPSKILAGAKITGCLSMTVQTAVLIETLHRLGAQVRWCSCSVLSTQDHAAAAIAKAGSAAVFAWKQENLREYWDCAEKAVTWPEADGPNLLIDDGGDVTLLIHEGVKAELAYETDKSVKPDSDSTGSLEFKEVLRIIASTLEAQPTKWRDISKQIVGVSEETTTGVLRLNGRARAGELLFSAINVNDSVTKSKFDNIYGCRHSLPDGIMRATDVIIAGKQVVICGYGDVGKGCAAAMKSAGARVAVTEVDPICALQAAMEGFSVRLLESVIGSADIFVTATGDIEIIKAADMAQMKNNAIVGNIGHSDTEIDMASLEIVEGIRKVNIKPQVDRYIFPDGHAVIVLAEGRMLNLGCATGHPSFVMSCSFTNQVLAQIELWESRNTDKYGRQVYVLPKELDEKVARLHLDAVGVELTTLTSAQAEYIGVNVSGPYKKTEYRY